VIFLFNFLCCHQLSVSFFYQMATSTDVFPAPALPWPKDSLAKKGISVETIEYHYGKHHLGYVRKLNGIAANDQKVAKSTIEELIMKAEGGVFNLAAQIWNHSFYWEGMSAEGGGKPSGKLGDQIAKDFGTYEKFKEQFTTSATNHFGSGWIWLSWDDKKGTLVISDGHDAQNPMRDQKKPLLTIDVWEHAYYIDYKNDRPAYINSWWNCVDWKVVEKRFGSK